MGYSEIRVYVNLFYNDYKKKGSFSKKSKLKVSFSHEITGMGNTYSEQILHEKVSSYIDGFLSEKIYGKKIKLSIDADFIPKGNYILSLSYYLLP